MQMNQMVGPYCLLRQLGQGTFGEVWLAHHHDFDEDRAVKIPTDPRYIQQLRREGKIIYGLTHVNIVRGLDMNTFSDPPYVAMEYVPGVTLRQKLRATGKVPLDEAMGILRQVLAGLACAHEQGVLHRDLKPENVLLTAQGHVKVSDFGLGKVQAEVAGSILMSGSLVSQSGQNISGTLDYMSPQQRAGSDATAADDIYSVGIMACELLTGQRPGPVGIEKQFKKTGADARLVPVIERALEDGPADRFADVISFAEALSTALKPKTPPPPPLPTVRAQGPAVAAPRAAIPRSAGANSLGMNLVRIEPGSFLMGSSDKEEGHEDNEVQHRVKLTKPFYMAATTVTQKQWKAVMGTDPSYFKGETLPVEQVSWGDAVSFCRKLSEKEGKNYRLPTEAEWEYACRAGTTTPFNTGATISTGQANYNGNNTYGSGVKGAYRVKTTPVGSFKPNAWGLYDMHGNVWQWCSDIYAAYTGDATDPTGPDSNADHSSRVLRGGSWDDGPRNCRAAYRGGGAPGSRGGYIGFRVCLDF